MCKMRLFLVVLSIVCMSSLQAATLVQTGFDSSEGWSEGPVTQAPNPATGALNGSWASIGDISGAVSGKIDLASGGYDYATPKSGDGSMYLDRIGKSWPGNANVDTTVGWSNSTGSIFDLTVDVQVWNTSGYGVVGFSNATYTEDFGITRWIGGVLIEGTTGNVYARVKGGWSQIGQNYIFYPNGGTPNWGTLHLVANTETQKYSVYAVPTWGDSEIAVGTDLAFAQTVGDTMIRSAMFALGDSGSRCSFDNLTISSIPEPATISLLAVGLLGLMKRKQG